MGYVLGVVGVGLALFGLWMYRVAASQHDAEIAFHERHAGDPVREDVTVGHY